MKKHYLIILFLWYAVDSYSQAIDGPAGPDRGVCPGGSVTIGGTDSKGYCYSWKASPDDPTFIDLKSAKISVSPTQTTTYTLTIIGEDFSSRSTDEVTVRVLEGFNIALTNPKTVCDGEEVLITVTTIPSDNVFGDFIKCLKSNINFVSNPVSQSFGNLAGKSTLEFDGLDNNGHVRIKNSIWYATQPDGCNDESQFEIKAKANFNGIEVNSNSVKLTISADVHEGGCLYARTHPKGWFKGDIERTIQFKNNHWEGTVSAGSFSKSPDIEIIPPIFSNSQFFNMIMSEEIFHKGQMEGINGTLYCDLFLATNVIDIMISGNPSYIGNTRKEVEDMIEARFQAEKEFEIFRSEAATQPSTLRRCCIEAEAKNAIGAKFVLALNCSYNCPTIPTCIPQCK